MQVVRENLEKTLKNALADFSGTYMAVGALKSFLCEHPGAGRQSTVLLLMEVLKGKRHARRKMGYFLFREAALALCVMVEGAGDKKSADKVLTALKEVLENVPENCHRAVCEAMGSLETGIRGPLLDEGEPTTLPPVAWDDLIAGNRIELAGKPAWAGRSLITPLKGGKVLVIKFAREEDCLVSLGREVLWMHHLLTPSLVFDRRFDVPRPLESHVGPVRRIEGLPFPVPEGRSIHPDSLAIAFTASADYFAYPNEKEKNKRLGRESFREALLRNGFLLGKLSSMGIVHTAPIPLFHNRVQRSRRSDLGLYEWPKAGRLDRWLSSSWYPNFGLSGLRDFEHVESFCGPAGLLYRHIGSHLLSLILVAGSYMRSRAGADDVGGDYCHLFDPLFFEELLREIFLSYYHGITGDEFDQSLPVDLSHITARLVREMGKDQHMEEVLRVVDQKNMSDTEFAVYLKTRNFSLDEIQCLEKGKEDIVAVTGPHLGGFNSRISVPELIGFLETASALSVAALFLKRRFGRNPAVL